MVRVLICASVRFYRDGLADALPKHAPILIAGTVGTAEALGQRLQADSADVVVIDGGLQGSETAVRELKQSHPSTHFVVVAVQESVESVTWWAEAGVSGYASRDDSIPDLARVVMDATRGRLRCPEDIAAGMMRRLHAMASRMEPDTAERGPMVSLTPREEEIVELVNQGLSNKRIASQLGISVATTKNHVHNILRKLGVGRRGEAAAMVRKWRAKGRRPRGLASHS